MKRTSRESVNNLAVERRRISRRGSRVLYAIDDPLALGLSATSAKHE